jgi:hypothetical protein
MARTDELIKPTNSGPQQSFHATTLPERNVDRTSMSAAIDLQAMRIECFLITVFS